MTKVRTAAGDELSDADIETLADEAERGYALDESKAVRMGRPPLGEAGPSPRLQVRLDAQLADALAARARREHRSISETARRALREYVDRPG
jgi:CRISPR-associated endonuclease/helicase Cas3